MAWHIDDLIRLTAAHVVRWSGPDCVVPIHEPCAASPGALFFVVEPEFAQPELLQYLAACGAAGVVLFRGQEHLLQQSLDAMTHLSVLSMESPLDGYAVLARAARESWKSRVVAITGSAGKSSTKEYVASILRRKYAVNTTVESDNHAAFTCSLLMGMRGEPDEAAVIEMGFLNPGDIEFMASIARPHVGIITCIAPAHLDSVQGSVARIAQEKGALTRHIDDGGSLLINASDPLSRLIPLEGVDANILRFGEWRGTEDGVGLASAHSNVHVDEEGTSFDLHLGGEVHGCRLRLYGEHQAENACAAALCASYLGVPAEGIAEGLFAAPPLPHRFRLYRFNYGLTVIDDTFSAGFRATLRGAETAAQIARDRQKVAVVSGGWKLHDGWRGYYTAIGRRLVECGFGHIVLVLFEPRAMAIAEGALRAGLPRDSIHLVPEPFDISAVLAAFARPETLIYCKARPDARATEEIERFMAMLSGSPFGRPVGGTVFA